MSTGEWKRQAPRRQRTSRKQLRLICTPVLFTIVSAAFLLTAVSCLQPTDTAVGDAAFSVPRLQVTGNPTPISEGLLAISDKSDEETVSQELSESELSEARLEIQLRGDREYTFDLQLFAENSPDYTGISERVRDETSRFLSAGATETVELTLAGDSLMGLVPDLGNNRFVRFSTSDPVDDYQAVEASLYDEGGILDQFFSEDLYALRDFDWDSHENLYFTVIDGLGLHEVYQSPGSNQVQLPHGMPRLRTNSTRLKRIPLLSRSIDTTA